MSTPIQQAWKDEFAQEKARIEEEFQKELRWARYTPEEWKEIYAYDLLRKIGVPFLPDGAPLGIGDD